MRRQRRGFDVVSIKLSLVWFLFIIFLFFLSGTSLFSFQSFGIFCSYRLGILDLARQNFGLYDNCGRN